jgi:hypothetical protein
MSLATLPEVTEDDVIDPHFKFSIRLPLHLTTHASLSLISPLCWSALPVNRLRLAPMSFRFMLPGVCVNLLRYGFFVNHNWDGIYNILQEIKAGEMRSSWTAP